MTHDPNTAESHTPSRQQASAEPQSDGTANSAETSQSEGSCTITTVIGSHGSQQLHTTTLPPEVCKELGLQ